MDVAQHEAQRSNTPLIRALTNFGLIVVPGLQGTASRVYANCNPRLELPAVLTSVALRYARGTSKDIKPIAYSLPSARIEGIERA